MKEKIVGAITEYLRMYRIDADCEHESAESIYEDCVKEFVENTADSFYTDHFLKWREKYFKHEVFTTRWKSKAGLDRYDDAALCKKYEQAMLQTPFKK